MKINILLVAILLTNMAFGQHSPNTMRVLIDGTEYKCEPRKIARERTVGWMYITGNTVQPDKTIQICLRNFRDVGQETTLSKGGDYIIIPVKETRHLEKAKFDKLYGDKYAGWAFAKYVEETKTPRMEFRVGISENNNEVVHLNVAPDGFLEVTFDNCSLAGSIWKEKTAATVFGGLGRLEDKLINKATTAATGYDRDMTPNEGWEGYRKLKDTDRINLTAAKIRLAPGK